MTETIAQEGVIKYTLEHQSKTIEPSIDITTINAWRALLYQLQLIGQNPEKYAGYGYGNISQRLNTQQFLITGTQTGHLATLSRQNYCVITQASPAQNFIQSYGETNPSSEALTHASVYQHNPLIKAVIHVHSPLLWQYSQVLKLAYTAEDVAYGTPAMGHAISEQMGQIHTQQTQIISLLGHEDGIITFAHDLTTAGQILIDYYLQALGLSSQRKNDGKT